MKRLAVLVALLGSLLTPSQSRTFTGISAPDAVAAGPSASVVGGSSYRFSTVLAGRPVRWNPCAAIHFRFNRAGAPAGGLSAVRSAIARIGQATGTHWVEDGASGSIPSTSWLPRALGPSQPILIGWTDAAHSDLLRGKPSGVLGVTRTAWFGRTSATSTVVAIRGAVIALDSTDHLPATGTMSWRSVALHELGHVMGLDHASSSSQLMYPVLRNTLSDLQSGDLRGLAALGRSQGCINL